MSKKLTIDFISAEFLKEWYILLTKIYINSKQKLEYICPNGHKHFIIWNSWQQGVRCPYCAGNIKLTIDFICAEFEKEGYKLLTKEYINAHQKLEYICPEGHKHSTVWDNWQKGKRCPYCAGLVKLTIEFVKESFEKKEYDLLTKEYINSYQKLDYICPEGHKHSTVWGSWQKGHRCPTCAVIKNSGCTHSNWKGGISKEPYCQDWSKDLKEFIKERDGYQCLNPDCWHKDNTLSIHHINYQKKVCESENLITVCRSCNTRANKDRDWHKNWYQAILHKRYSYNYLED